ncbi:MAG: peptidylprolyl isomerase [Oscillospiraceae bacterium]|jgi:peptidyl-prolyl cis-trans isomerase B (cyclophilin B)|nr:peptidylprolyl isomerase [Oscillospiraceae bacterium]
MKGTKLLAALLAATALLGAFSGCGKKQNPQVTLHIKDGGTIVIELYPDKAPNTVKNFLFLVNDGYFNGKKFHRAEPDFVIQGGSPDDAGSGFFPYQYAISGEFAENGFTQNDLSHTRGVISMARTDNPNSADCQFFLCVGDASDSLDGKYAAFGKVIEGMDEVDRIAALPTVSQGQLKYLVDPVVIESAEANTFGVKYGSPAWISTAQ